MEETKNEAKEQVNSEVKLLEKQETNEGKLKEEQQEIIELSENK